MKIIGFILLSLSVLITVYWLGIEVAYLYLNQTLAITFDWSLLFFPGNSEYFWILSGTALYFILDIFYNLFIRKGSKSKNRKRRLTIDEKRNYKRLAGYFESRKGLTRLEFDSSGHLTNVDYSTQEVLIGKAIALVTISCLMAGTVLGIYALIPNTVPLGNIFESYTIESAYVSRAKTCLLISMRGAVLFVVSGYLFSLFHQEWTAFDRKTTVSRLMKLHLRDYCDDVFDSPKRLWNNLIGLLHLSDSHKFNTKSRYRIGGESRSRRGGFPILTFRSRIYVNAADCHSLVVATTRSGKSYSIMSIMIDDLRMAGESMVINDPKGELKDSQVQKLLNDGYDVYFLNFIEPEKGDCWNPLGTAIRKYREAQGRYKAELLEWENEWQEEIDTLKVDLDQADSDEERNAILDFLEEVEESKPTLDSSAAQESLQDIARAMTYDEKDSNGQFWNSQAGELIVGYANLLLEEEKTDSVTGEVTPLPDDLIHFKSIKQVSLAGAEPIGNKGDTVLSKYLKQYRSSTDKSVTSLGQYVSAPGPTKGSIDSVFSDKSRMMTMSESVMRMTSKSTFDLRDISEKKSAVFIVVHGDKSTYYPFVTMFIEQMYEESMAVARAHGGRMPYPVNCVFDEAGIMPSLKSIDNMVSFGASAGFRLTLAVQDTSQLEHRYGKEKSRTIMNNMQNFTYLMGGDNETLKTVSEKAGKRLVWSDERGDFEEKPVVSPDRLSVFSLGEALTIQLRRNPILTRLLGYNKYCFYKDMPKGNAEKNNTVRNVRYFDLADVYRKRESARMKVDSENKTSSASDKGNSKKHAVKDRSESKADKKKPTDKPALNSSVFMDLNNVSIHEKKEA